MAETGLDIWGGRLLLGGIFLIGDDPNNASTLDLYELTAGIGDGRCLLGDEEAFNGGGSNKSSPSLLAGEYGESSTSKDVSSWPPFWFNILGADLDGVTTLVATEMVGGGVEKFGCEIGGGFHDNTSGNVCFIGSTGFVGICLVGVTITCWGCGLGCDCGEITTVIGLSGVLLLWNSYLPWLVLTNGIDDFGT